MDMKKRVLKHIKTACDGWTQMDISKFFSTKIDICVNSSCFSYLHKYILPFMSISKKKIRNRLKSIEAIIELNPRKNSQWWWWKRARCKNRHYIQKEFKNSFKNSYILVFVYLILCILFSQSLKNSRI